MNRHSFPTLISKILWNTLILRWWEYASFSLLNTISWVVILFRGMYNSHRVWLKLIRANKHIICHIILWSVRAGMKWNILALSYSIAMNLVEFQLHLNSKQMALILWLPKSHGLHRYILDNFTIKFYWYAKVFKDFSNIVYQDN